MDGRSNKKDEPKRKALDLGAISFSRDQMRLLNKASIRTSAGAEGWIEVLGYPSLHVVSQRQVYLRHSPRCVAEDKRSWSMVEGGVTVNQTAERATYLVSSLARLRKEEPSTSSPVKKVNTSLQLYGLMIVLLLTFFSFAPLQSLTISGPTPLSARLSTRISSSGIQHHSLSSSTTGSPSSRVKAQYSAGSTLSNGVRTSERAWWNTHNHVSFMCSSHLSSLVNLPSALWFLQSNPHYFTKIQSICTALLTPLPLTLLYHRKKDRELSPRGPSPRIITYLETFLFSSTVLQQDHHHTDIPFFSPPLLHGYTSCSFLHYLHITSICTSNINITRISYTPPAT